MQLASRSIWGAFLTVVFSNATFAESNDTTELVRKLLQEALEETLANSSPGSEVAPPKYMGAPLNSDEKEQFRTKLRECWINKVGQYDGVNVRVTLAVELTRDGKPLSESIVMLHSSGPEAAIDAFYHEAKYTILTCNEGKGYSLPAGKYELWHKMELTFDTDLQGLR